MARTRSISSIDAEISKLEDELSKVQEKYDALAARILELQKQKQDIEARQVMEAFKRSGKSMQELMNFLDV
jgi:phage shock protein A